MGKTRALHPHERPAIATSDPVKPDEPNLTMLLADVSTVKRRRITGAQSRPELTELAATTTADGFAVATLAAAAAFVALKAKKGRWRWWGRAAVGGRCGVCTPHAPPRALAP